jgi:hypothetical protein
MEGLATLFGGEVVPPFAVVAGSVVVSKVLRIPLFLTLTAVIAPLVVPYVDIPGIGGINRTHPYYSMAAVWIAVVLCALGWGGVRSLLSMDMGSFNPIKFGYGVASIGALVAAVLLLLQPDILQQFDPAWRTSAGGVLLGVSLVGATAAFGRLLRASASLVLRLAVSLVLASELVLHKLPHHVTTDDLKRLESVVSYDTLKLVFGAWGGVARFGRGLVGSLWVSGDSPFRVGPIMLGDAADKASDIVVPSRHEGDVESEAKLPSA